MSQRILIVGASGLVGNSLYELFSKNYQVLGTYNTNKINNLIHLNLLDNKQLVNLLKKFSPEIILFPAALSNVEFCEKNHNECWKHNVIGTLNLVNLIKKSPIKLVYYSTDYIFDGTKGSPYREDDPPNPLSIYGESKLMGERYIEEILDDYVIVRTQWLYGKHGRNFVETILALAEERDHIEVVHDQQGSPTYTADLSRAIAALISRNLRGAFHVSNSGFCSWYDFALEIVQLANSSRVEIVPISSTTLNRPAKRPLYSILNCQRLEQETDFGMRSWQKALRDYFDHRGQ